MREYNRLTNRGTPYYAFDKCKTCEYGKDGCDKWCDQIVGCFCRLQELEDKIENGTLVELPCRLGEHFVIIDYGFNRFKVEKVKIIGFNFSTYDKTIYPVDEYETYYTPDKVFDAEEAAEARLKELQEKQK